MAEVAALAATAAVVLDSVAITATRWRIRSAANSGNLSSLPCAQRNSIATFLPSTSPASLSPFAESGQTPGVRLGRTGMQKSDDRHRRLLRARHERPRDRAASDQRDEIAPSHDLLRAG
jgi:hypothetical protein